MFARTVNHTLLRFYPQTTGLVSVAPLVFSSSVFLSALTDLVIHFNSTELPVPLEINLLRKVMASANCDSSFRELTVFVCGARFLEFLISWCLNWLHYLQPCSVFTRSCSSPVVRGVQQLGRAKLEWGPATVCLYFSGWCGQGEGSATFQPWVMCWRWWRNAPACRDMTFSSNGYNKYLCDRWVGERGCFGRAGGGLPFTWAQAFSI